MNTFFTLTIRWFQLLLIILLVVLLSTISGYFTSTAEQFLPMMLMLISVCMLFLLAAMFCGFLLREKWAQLNSVFKIVLMFIYVSLFILPTLFYGLKLLYETFL
jgi:phosphatidylinositol kinase/protein kinase (PI-3  family)